MKDEDYEGKNEYKISIYDRYGNLKWVNGKIDGITFLLDNEKYVLSIRNIDGTCFWIDVIHQTLSLIKNISC